MMMLYGTGLPANCLFFLHMYFLIPVVLPHMRVTKLISSGVYGTAWLGPSNSESARIELLGRLGQLGRMRWAVVGSIS